MNQLERCARLLQEQFESHGATMVTYRRPGEGEFGCPAILGNTVSEQDTGSGLIVRTTTADFTIHQNHFKAFADKRPRRNDEIQLEVGGDIVVYKVNGDAGQSHYDETDRFGVAFRIRSMKDRVDA